MNAAQKGQKEQEKPNRRRLGRHSSGGTHCEEVGGGKSSRFVTRGTNHQPGLVNEFGEVGAIVARLNANLHACSVTREKAATSAWDMEFLERARALDVATSEASNAAECGPHARAASYKRFAPHRKRSRILLDMPCKVCLDHSSGKHYGIFACDGCAGFFKRSIRRNRQYVCKARGAAANGCPVDKTHRNQCRACRLRKCLEAGMNREAVQHERGPRNSTIRRQVALYLKEGHRPTGFGLPVPSAALSPGAAAGVLSAAGAAAAAAAAASVGSPFAALHPGAAGFRWCDTRCSEQRCGRRRLLHDAVAEAPCLERDSAIQRRRCSCWKKGWREMFVLSAAQFNLPLEVAPLLAAAGLSSEPTTSDRVEALISDIRNFQDVVAKLKDMGLDPSEYTCMKAIALFKTNFPGQPPESLPLRDPEAVGAMQDQAQTTLMRCVQTAHPTQPHRFGKILLALAWLSTVPSATIEELFFRKTIGTIPIARLLGDMYKTGGL
ncbi:hypothetical protein MRX96_047323 [Rhipicephalus microplus]